MCVQFENELFIEVGDIIVQQSNTFKHRYLHTVFMDSGLFNEGERVAVTE